MQTTWLSHTNISPVRDRINHARIFTCIIAHWGKSHGKFAAFTIVIISVQCGLVLFKIFRRVCPCICGKHVSLQVKILGKYRNTCAGFRRIRFDPFVLNVQFRIYHRINDLDVWARSEKIFSKFRTFLNYNPIDSYRKCDIMQSLLGLWCNIV